ncbi:hypothetical protein Tco_0420587 [Tanacetum coccineum]
MAAHTERIERFENAIFKQREEINDKMTKISGLLKELTTSRAPEKVLIREEAKFPVTKNVNSISLTRGGEERSEKIDVTTGDDFEKPTKIETLIKAYLLEDKQIPSVGVFDEVFSTWMTFRGNTHDLSSFREETDEITDLHQILEEVLLTEREDGVTSIKRRRCDLFSDGVWNLETASGRGRLKEDLESST